MTRSTGRRLTKPLDEPEIEFRRRRRAAWRLHQNESLAIAGRNLFDDETSSSNNTRTKSSTPLKTLREHSRPNSSDFQNPIILPIEQIGKIFDSRDILLIQGMNKFEDELANFMLEKKFHTNGIGEMLDQHRKKMYKQFSQILSTIRESKFPKLEAPTFTITTRSGISTRYPSFLTQSQLTPTNHAEETTEREGPEGAESSIVKNEETPRKSLKKRPPQSSLVRNVLLSSKKLTPKGRRPREFHATMSYQTLGSKECPGSFRVLEMDEDELVPIILRRPFLATTWAVIDVHEGKIEHDGKWTEAEDEGDSNELQAVSLYPRTELVDPLEWKALENQLKPSSVEPPELELTELPEHLEYAFL
ncbi:hypothetical protein Tco_1244411 [Tanacetum coccineum]